MSGVGLYLHIPFCHARCHYCDFATHAGQEKQIPRYLEALKKEMALYRGTLVDTIFIGGGTPTVLTPPEISDLFREIRQCFTVAPDAEISIEANPESATAETLAAYRQSGVNRISIGVQSFDDVLLLKLGRLHTAALAEDAFHRARAAGFQNINLDFMFGLPGQSLESWRETLGRAVSLQPEHLSAYALKIEDGTPFDRHDVMVDDDVEADMYIALADDLLRHGFHHYEISNFSKPGFECRHNLKYWMNAETLGLGLSAASFRQGERIKNTENLGLYMESVQKNGRPSFSTESLSPEKQKMETLMLALRTSVGVPVVALKKFGAPILERFIRQGFLFENGNRYRMNAQGWLLSNQLFVELLG